MVKIDMGAHIDGFIAVVAHTVVISDEKTKITGRKADTILAAHLASEAALRLVKPGNEVCSIVLKLDFSEIRVRTWVQAVSCLKNRSLII